MARRLASQRQRRVGGEAGGGEFSSQEARPGSGGDHGGIVGGEGESGEGYMDGPAVGFGGEALAELAVGGYAAGDEDAARAGGFGGGKGLLEEVADHGVLKAGHEIEDLLGTESEGFVVGLWGREWFACSGIPGPSAAADERTEGTRPRRLWREESGGAGMGLGAEAVEFDVAEDGGFDSGKREEEARVELCDGSGFGGLGARGLTAQVKFGFDLSKCEGHRFRIAEAGQGIDPGAAGIAKAEKLGDLVVGFAGGVVDGAADEAVGPGPLGGLGEIEVGVAARDDQGEGGLVVAGVEAIGGRSLFEEDGVDVAFKMIDGDEREALGEGEGFGVGDADEECAGEAGAGGNGDGV